MLTIWISTRSRSLPTTAREVTLIPRHDIRLRAFIPRGERRIRSIPSNDAPHGNGDRTVWVTVEVGTVF